MITLVTGGARSGKSSFAESIYLGQDDVVYIATSRPSDKEMENRIEMHKQSRPSQWRTFEGHKNLSQALGQERNYLLDCLTVMTSNIMFEETKDMDRIDPETERRLEDMITEEIKELIGQVRARNYNLVLVSNELGSSIVPENHLARVFRDIQGRINQRVGKMADSAYLVAAGFPVRLK